MACRGEIHICQKFNMIKFNFGQKKIRKLSEIYFLQLQKKIEKNIISPNFNPNNLELYMRVGIHLEHNNFEGRFS